MRIEKKRLSLLFVFTPIFFLLLLLSSPARAAEYFALSETEEWTSTFYSPNSTRKSPRFTSAAFDTDGTLLAFGFRGETHSSSAIAVGFDATTGTPIDPDETGDISELILFENTYDDFAHDRFFDVFISDNGDIYLAGSSYAAGWNIPSDYFLVPNLFKYGYDAGSTVPVQRWRKYHSTASAGDGGQFVGIAVDSVGNIYAAGSFGAATDNDWLISKYDSDGNVISGFPITHGNTGNHDQAQDIAVDSADNFIVAGYTRTNGNDGNDSDAHVRKYNSSGTLLWQTTYDGPGGLLDYAYKVLVDSEDNIIVCGVTNNGTSTTTQHDWLIIKYAKDANPATGEPDVLWQQTWDSGVGKDGHANALAADGTGNFFVGGYQKTDGIVYRPFVQHRSGLTGNLISSLQLSHTDTSRPGFQPTPSDEHDYVSHLIFDEQRLFVTGYSYNGGIGFENRATGRMTMLLVHSMDLDDDGIADNVEDANLNGIVDPGETDRANADTDGDGIQDGTETGVTEGVADPDGAGPLSGTDTAVFQPDADPASTTDPLNPDSDCDGISDGDEDINHDGMVDPGETDPMAPLDIDGDGIPNCFECLNTNDADTDDDGLSDGTEDANANGVVDAGETDPCNADTDGDGIQDGTESGVTEGVADPDGAGPLLGTDTAVFQPDADPASTTDPLDLDTDDDGIADNVEDANLNGMVDDGETDPANADTDGDGIQDGTETGVTEGVADPDGAGPLSGTDTAVFQPDADPASTTDPLDLDTDDDGISDGTEDANANGVVDAGETDPCNADTDGDGIQDGTESGVTEGVADPDGAGPLLGTDTAVFQPDADPASTTDPLNPDSDGDGILDGDEDLNLDGGVDAGETDPNKKPDGIFFPIKSKNGNTVIIYLE